MEDKFSAGEVRTLVEELKSEFRTVAEVVVPLREDMVEVKERLTSLEDEVRLLKDVVKGSIPDLTKRVGRLESKVG